MQTRGNRRLNLGTKLIVLTSALVLTTAFVIGVYAIRDEQKNDYELLLDHGRSLALMIAQNSAQGISTEDKAALRQIINLVSTDPSIAYIFILNADERVLLYKTAEDFPIHIPAMPRVEGGREARLIRYQPFYNREDGKHYVNIVAPVVTQDSNGPAVTRAAPDAGPGVIGSIHLGVSQEALRSRLRHIIVSIAIFTSLIIIAGVIVTILVTRRIIAPINDLNQATRDIAEGKLDRLIDIRSNDEVSDLAGAFNQMLVQLQASHDKVERHTAELTVALDRMQQEMAVRERTEQALKESERKYRVIFEESKDVIFICSQDGKFLDINRAGADLFGYASADALQALDPARDLFDQPEQHTILQSMLLRQGLVKDHEVTLRRSYGERLTVLVTASIVREAPGPGWTYRGAFHDVTEKRRLEQQLVQSQKMEAIGQLAGGIAHDFNNILTAIMGYANLLVFDLAEDSPLAHHAEHIISSADRAANLTRSLLAFSRKQVISPKPVNLNVIVAGIEKLLATLIGEHIELRTSFEANDVIVLADSGNIEQVLINLCTNARDAMPNGGRVTIGISKTGVSETPAAAAGGKPGPYALIAVSDTGMGIDERIREKIFEPFFTTKETGKGTGLGLSIVYGIIQQHAGFVTLQSESGKGTRFSLYLPLIEGSGSLAEKQPLPLPRGGSETILVAEDDPDVRTLIRLVLRGNGYQVIETVDGQDALAVISRHQSKIHLLLLDVIMPKKNGKEVYDTVKNVDPDIKAVFMSGYTADIIDKKGILAENLHFLPKPIVPHELLTIVRQALDRER